jgi:hypothetical protein
MERCPCGWKLPEILFSLPPGERFPCDIQIIIACPECGTMMTQIAMMTLCGRGSKPSSRAS